MYDSSLNADVLEIDCSYVNDIRKELCQLFIVLK